MRDCVSEGKREQLVNRGRAEREKVEAGCDGAVEGKEVRGTMQATEWGKETTCGDGRQMGCFMRRTGSKADVDDGDSKRSRVSVGACRFVNELPMSNSHHCQDGHVCTFFIDAATSILSPVLRQPSSRTLLDQPNQLASGILFS